jgi:hypothetical protein
MLHIFALWISALVRAAEPQSLEQLVQMLNAESQVQEPGARAPGATMPAKNVP